MRKLVFCGVFILLLLQFCCGNLWARPTTAQEAEMVVTGWLKADAQPLGTHLGRHVTTVETFSDDYGRAVYYIVYLYPSGFVIVSGDDLVEPIIGFTDYGTYEPSPENPLGALVTNDLNGRVIAVRSTQRLLGSAKSPTFTDSVNKWSHFISFAETFDDEFGIMGLVSISDIRVAPLVQSRWAQGSVCGNLCYNYYTPNNYACGCVATAMAQVMRYHQHPTTGIGVHEFMIKVDGKSQSASTRGGGSGSDGRGGGSDAYQWSQMVHRPDCGTTLAQRQAIGALCYDASVAIETAYSAGSSSSYNYKAKATLLSIFDYTNAIIGWNENRNIGAELNGMVNPNLDAGGPVIFGIGREQGGHAIICDGYGYNASTLYHHLNMGWAGSADAWYNLPTVDVVPPYDTVIDCIYNIFTSGSGEIISGRVTDTSGNPIGGAAVQAEGDGGPYNDLTDNKGIYALAKIKPNSTYTVGVTASGYKFTPKTVETGKSRDDRSFSGNKWGVDFSGMEPCQYNCLEDFETRDFSKFPWTHSGNSNWIITSAEKHSGTYSAQSGWIGDGDSATLQVTRDCIAGNITFYRKVSSELDYDRLIFYIDGVKRGEWSGQQDWAQVSFLVTAGQRKFEWTYSKDSSTSEGSDIAWIDDIVFPIQCSQCQLAAPVLLAEPDVTPGFGNTISWAPIPGAGRYYTECASDGNFTNIVGNSGWISGTSYTFVGLQPEQRYWYRVKCRPSETWLQTSQSDFESDILTDTRATNEGDVVLVGGSSQTRTIVNPSCEAEIGGRTGWTSYQTDSARVFPQRSLDWATDGSYSFGIIFTNGYHNVGDYGCFRQTVDWTGVDTLMFDCFIKNVSQLRSKVLIGGTEVWSSQATGVYLNVVIDVSRIVGSKILELRYEAIRAGTFVGSVYFDNLRTYGSADYAPFGDIISAAVDLPAGYNWTAVDFRTTTPLDTNLTVDVLGASGSTPIPGYENGRSPIDLSGISESTIRLRGNLFTSNPNNTPVLHDWSVIYTKASCESDWSNVESSFQRR